MGKMKKNSVFSLIFAFWFAATYGPISSEADDLSNISNLGSVSTVVKENTSVILELRGLLKYNLLKS